METLLLDACEPASKITENSIKEAARLLRAGGIVAIPTETVYGLAADAFNTEAVAKIFVAKGRPQDNPLIVHTSDMDMLHSVAAEVPDKALRLAQAFWPGPLTMILPKAEALPMVTTAGLDSVGVRMPSDPVAHRLIELSGPLAAPSANLSGKPSPTTARHCIDDLTGRVDAILCSRDCSVGVESTVILMTGEIPVLLRPGGITLEQLRAVLGEVKVDKGVLAKLDVAAPRSPGMKYKHYAPLAKVTLVRADRAGYCRYIAAQPAGEDARAVCFDEEAPMIGDMRTICYGGEADQAAQAERIFAVLRELDAEGVSRAYIHAPEPSGIGLATYNRLLRAAAFDVADLRE